jgi:hypothetical protein
MDQKPLGGQWVEQQKGGVEKQKRQVDKKPAQQMSQSQTPDVPATEQEMQAFQDRLVDETVREDLKEAQAAEQSDAAANSPIPKPAA